MCKTLERFHVSGAVITAHTDNVILFFKNLRQFVMVMYRITHHNLSTLVQMSAVHE